MRVEDETKPTCARKRAPLMSEMGTRVNDDGPPILGNEADWRVDPEIVGFTVDDLLLFLMTKSNLLG